jgi:hypothetical protein
MDTAGLLAALDDFGYSDDDAVSLTCFTANVDNGTNSHFVGNRVRSNLAPGSIFKPGSQACTLASVTTWTALARIACQMPRPPSCLADL